MLDRERLAQTFSRLVRIDSVSKEEKAISEELCAILTSMDADIAQDDAGEKIGGQTGNIIAKFKGNVDVPPMFLNAHMDTVEPGRGVEPVL